MKLTTQDLEAVRETIKHQGSLRIHLMTSRSGGTCKARLWHPDGYVVGSAGGYGYDKRGAALGEAINLLFTQEQLFLLMPYDSKDKTGLYGVRCYVEDEKTGRTRTTVDGACGYEQMLKVLRTLGFTDAEMHNTGKLSDMVLARRNKR